MDKSEVFGIQELDGGKTPVLLFFLKETYPLAATTYKNYTLLYIGRDLRARYGGKGGGGNNKGH